MADDIVNFVAKFDPVQMRFLGRTFRKLIESIGNDKLYSVGTHVVVQFGTAVANVGTSLSLPSN